MMDLLIIDEGLETPSNIAELASACGVRIRLIEERPACSTPEFKRFLPQADALLFATRADQVPTRREELSALTAAHPDVVCIAILDGANLSPREQIDAVVALFKAGVNDVVPHDLAWDALFTRVRETVARVHPHCLPGALAGRERLVLRPDRTLAGVLACCHLTAKEAAIAALLLNKDDVVAREELAKALWDGQWRGTPKAIDMHVANLRRKIRTCAGEDYRIETVRGYGFYLASAAHDLEATG